MKLSELINNLQEMKDDLLVAHERFKEVEADPMVVMSSDEEGSSYHELMYIETEDKELFLFPGGYELEI